jgi:hypothetical protein
MPVTVTLTIEADDDRQLGKIFSAFGRALESEPRPPAQGAGEEHESGDRPGAEPPDPVAWYRAHSQAFVAALSPLAQQALAVIVREGPDVPIQVVRNATSQRGTGLAGTLASVGAACRRLGAPARPFKADHKRGIYRIEPPIMDALRPHIGAVPEA